MPLFLYENQDDSEDVIEKLFPSFEQAPEFIRVEEIEGNYALRWKVYQRKPTAASIHFAGDCWARDGYSR